MLKPQIDVLGGTFDQPAKCESRLPARLLSRYETWTGICALGTSVGVRLARRICGGGYAVTMGTTEGSFASSQALALSAEASASSRMKPGLRERLAAAILLSAYGLMGWSFYREDVCPYRVALDIYRGLAFELFTLWQSVPVTVAPATVAGMIAQGSIGVLSLLWLPFALQAAIRLCGWRGFLPGCSGWWGSFFLAVVTIAIQVVTYVPQDKLGFYIPYVWRVPFLFGCMLACVASFRGWRYARLSSSPAGLRTTVAAQRTPARSLSPPAGFERMAAWLVLAALLALWTLADTQNWSISWFSTGFRTGIESVLSFLDHEQVTFFDDDQIRLADGCLALTMVLSLPLTAQACLVAHGWRGFWPRLSFWWWVCAHSIVFAVSWLFMASNAVPHVVSDMFHGASTIVVTCAIGTFCIGFFASEGCRSDA